MKKIFLIVMLLCWVRSAEAGALSLYAALSAQGKAQETKVAVEALSKRVVALEAQQKKTNELLQKLLDKK